MFTKDKKVRKIIEEYYLIGMDIKKHYQGETFRIEQHIKFNKMLFKIIYVHALEKCISLKLIKEEDEEEFDKFFYQVANEMEAQNDKGKGRFNFKG